MTLACSLGHSLLYNGMGAEGAKAIVDVVKDKPQLVSLCGIKPEQTEADFSNQRLTVGDAILLAFDLQKNSVLIQLKYAAVALVLTKMSAATDSPSLPHPSLAHLPYHIFLATSPLPHLPCHLSLAWHIFLATSSLPPHLCALFVC